jgi:hypothetical protein
MDEKQQFSVAVLLATRGRTKSLNLCITSMVNRATHKDKIQFIFAFDRDDYVGFGYFNDVLKHWLNERKINYQVVITERYGYIALNRYYNIMARMAEADWLMMWGDDAIMETDGWDQHIAKKTGEFKVLSVLTHKEHPYSIFPIVPRMWVRLLGVMSTHQVVDAETSQMAYLLDIFERIPVYVTHDRFDLTGNNKDATYDERVYLEHNVNDPRDFRHPNNTTKRIQNIERLAQYMKNIGLDTSWWESIKNGTNKIPFAKLKDNDPHGQVDTSPPKR